MRRQSELYTRWSLETRRNRLFKPGERVGVAVSGGPDSVLLLDFMRHLARKAGLVLSVVHFNHRLRGRESNEDESFVRELAQKSGLEYMRGEADVGRAARETGRNLEATARDLRYRFFFSLINQGRLEKVATAHTANDQAETILLRLFRGTGTRGLCGIHPVLEGKIVRPFLNLTRNEIEKEITKRRLEFRVDSTNRNVKLRRNKLRLELLPFIEAHFNPEIVRLLKEFADRSRDDEAYLEEQARERTRPWWIREGTREKIPIRSFLEFPPCIARRALRQMIMAVSGSSYSLAHSHIEALRRFISEGQSGRTLLLPGNVVAEREFDWLIIKPAPSDTDENDFSYPVKVPGEVFIKQLGITIRFKICSPEEARRAYNQGELVGLDCEKVSDKLVLRNWRAGDRFWPRGGKKPLKLKVLFYRRKIAPSQRKLWPVLENGDELVWVRGFSVAQSKAATPEAKRILWIFEEAAPTL